MPRLTGSLEDREQIRELYARYAIYVDQERFDDWVDCFTADGTFESPVFGIFSGRERLQEFTRLYYNSWSGGGVRHMMVNVSFDIAGESATGFCNLIYFSLKDGGFNLAAIGGYNDKLRKGADGLWRYTHRKVHIDK